MRAISPPKQTETLTVTAWLNSAVMVAEYAVRSVVAFLLTPVLLASFGPIGFGIWQMIDRLASYLASMDGRSNQVLRWSVATNKNPEELPRMIGAALSAYLTFMPLFGTAAVAVVLCIPYWAPQLPTEVVAGATILVITAVAVAAMGGIADAVLAGRNLGYKEAWIVTTVPLASGISVALTVGLGRGGIRTAAAVQLGAATCAATAIWLLARHIVPHFGVARPSWTQYTTYVRKSAWFFGWTLVDRTLLAADVVIIGALASPLLVSHYVVTGYIPLLALNVTALAISAANPGLGQILARQDYRRLGELRRELQTLVLLVAGTVGTIIISFNKQFVSAWVGAEHFAVTLITILTMVGVFQWLFIRIDSGLIDLSLDLRKKVLLGGCSALLAAGGAAVLLASYGLPGLCVGLIAGRCAMGTTYPILVKKLLRGHVATRNSLCRPLAVIAFLWMVFAALENTRYSSYRLVSILIAPLTMYWVGFAPGDRNRLTQRLAAVLTTRRLKAENHAIAG